MIETGFSIYFPDGRQETRVVKLAEEPGYDDLRALICPIIGDRFEHVWIRADGEEGVGRTSMFVDDCGHLKRLPRNDAATDLYRRAHVARHPKGDPETLPFIVGVAVVFDRPVWF